MRPLRDDHLNRHGLPLSRKKGDAISRGVLDAHANAVYLDVYECLGIAA